MPALRAFGRRWAVASDDFFFPALTELLFRSAWIIVVSALITIHISSGGLNNSCTLDLNLNIFYFWTLALYLLLIVLNIALAVFSTRGSVMNDAPRSAIPTLLYIRLFLILPETALNVFGSVWIFHPIVGEDEQCDTFIKGAVPVAQTLIVISWLLFSASLVFCIVIFDPLGREPIGLDEDFSPSSSNTRVWERRCRLLCCCFAGSQAEYNEIGHMLAEYFQDTDMVATDIAAGMALLAAQQQGEICHKKHPPHFQIEHIPKWMNLNNALHFMPYAAAMYGWPFYLFSGGCGGCCRLCSSSLENCFVAAARQAPVTGDNCLRCNLAALRHHITDIDLNNLVTLELKNRLYEVPFMVCADPQKKVIVVAIRGTLSLADAVTDITARAEPFAPNEIPDSITRRESSGGAEWYAHKGILRAARWVVKRLVDDGVLQQAFDTHPTCNQGIVVVGHSLGAGTAALVSVLLKNRCDDVVNGKELKCFSYAPPGGLISRALNQSVGQDLICAVTLSGDLVPRLSLPNMLRLKYEVISALRRSSLPKYRIFGGVLYSTACCVKGDLLVQRSRPETVEEGYLPVPNSEEDSLLVNNSQSHNEGGAVNQTVRNCSLAAEPRLYLPGRVLTIDEVKDISEPAAYSATFCDPEKCFNSITIGTDMVRHHLPHALHQALLANPKEWPIIS